ncbi:MAG: hypothetical protein OXC48_03905 [Endozoicomonadaceae bacterium]|nr:hypothetical protein [Endozoicomonadaceae bacterium]
MQFLYYLLKQKKELVVKRIKNEYYQYIIKAILLMLSCLLLTINPVYAGSHYTQKQTNKIVFVTEEELVDKERVDNELFFLAKTPMKALQILQKLYPNMPVESLYQYNFKARHQHLGEKDNERTTNFTSISGLKEVISVYSLNNFSPAIVKKSPFKITLSGMLKHLEKQKQDKDSQFQPLLKFLNTPIDTTAWYIYDGGTLDEAINNVAMEFYHSFEHTIKSLKSIFSGKKSNIIAINTNTLCEQCFKELCAMDKLLPNYIDTRYIVKEPVESLLTDEQDDTDSHQINRSQSNKSLRKNMGYLFGLLMVGQAVGTAASMVIPPALTSGSANSCLNQNGHCIAVGNANITRLMTENPQGNFIAAEDINGNNIFLNGTATESVVPGVFSGNFSTGLHSLNGFPINGTGPLFEAVNNSHIEVNVPVKSGNIPNNPHPFLTRQALHNNNVKTKLQWSDPSFDTHYTHPVTGNIAGDHNTFIIRQDIPRYTLLPYRKYILTQKDTGLIATNVSGNHNHLEHQGEVRISKTIDNSVPGNIVKEMSGIDNKLIQKGAFIISRPANSDQIYLYIHGYGYSSNSEARGILEVLVPVAETNTSRWGTVCSQGFSSEDRTIACRQMGFDRSIYYKDQQNSSRPVLLNNVKCLGNETSLLQCHYDTMNEHNCTQPPVKLRCIKELKYTENTTLYSGVSISAREINTNALFAFWDRDGYNDIYRFSQNNSVSTTKPSDWRKAHHYLCASEQCNISCHYVSEQFYSVVRSEGRTFLMSRQHYPVRIALGPLLDFDLQETRGLIRVTDISQPGTNGTIQLYKPPYDNTNLGKMDLSDPAVYTPPVSSIVINNTLLSLHRRPKFLINSGVKFLNLRGDFPGVQLSEIPLEDTDGTYHSINYDFPGETALLIDENFAFTYNEAEKIITKYPLEYDGEHYALDNANFTYQLKSLSDPIIAAGTDKDYLYIVTKGYSHDPLVEGKKLLFSRYNIETGEKDNYWRKIQSPGAEVDENNNYRLLLIDNEMQLIDKREVFNENHTLYRLQIPQYGGCSETDNPQIQYITPSDNITTSVNITTSRPDLLQSDWKANFGAMLGVMGAIAVGAIVTSVLCRTTNHNDNNTDNDNDNDHLLNGSEKTIKSVNKSEGNENKSEENINSVHTSESHTDENNTDQETEL